MLTLVYINLRNELRHGSVTEGKQIMIRQIAALANASRDFVKG
ncbi:MAG: hypothetical protein V7K21_20045 [Nostoc sp.]